MLSAIPSRTSGVARTLAFLVLGAGLLLFAPQAHAGDAAANFIQTRIEAGKAILTDPDLAVGERKRLFRDFLLSMTDMKRIALFTVGTYARGAKEADIQNFVAAFTEFSVGFYERVLDSYAGKTIQVTGSVRHSEDDATVNAEVVDPEAHAPHLKIAFRVRKNQRGDCILTDLQIEGAWLALTQRAEFMAFLQQHRGDLAQLSQELQTRARTIRVRGPRREVQS